MRVRDVSDENTLPFVQSVACTKLSGIQALCPLSEPQRVRLTAEGFWLDECDQPHPIEPYDTRFEYRWKIYDWSEGTTYEWSHSNWLELCLDCGCYDVEISVRQSGCPVVRTYRREIVVRPASVPCDPGRPFTFFYPQPDPAGTIGIVGLNDPNVTLGLGGRADERPLEYTVLVSPNCACPDNTDCPAARPSDVAFDLGVIQGTSFRPLGAQFLVDDLCDSTQEGPKFLHLALPDLGAVPASGLLDGYDPTNVYLIGRAASQPSGWAQIGGALRLYNPPPSLSESAWKCNFVEPACYLFETRSSESNESQLDLGASADLDLELPAVGDGDSQEINLAGHPDNGIGGGFASRFSLEAGVWSDEEGVGGTRGQLMGNAISGAPIEAEAGGGGGGAFGGGAGNTQLPEWEWCSGGNIFNYEFREDIYKGIVYTGTIWVIPVQVWAAIGFGFFFNIDYQLTFKLHPFSVLQGYEAECPENSLPPGQFSFADAYLYFLMDAGISIPASIRADILFGIASIGITIEPQANFSFTPWLEAHDLDFSPHMHLGADFKLFAYIQACILWELLCVTLPEDRTPIINEPIFSCPQDVFDCVCPSCIEKCDESATRECAGGGGGASDGGGAGVLQLVDVYELVSIPETISSPDGQTVIDIWMSAVDLSEGILNLRQRGSVNRDFQFTLNAPNPYFLDPTGAYVTGDVVLIAFTETDGNTIESVPPLDTDNPGPYLGPSNRNAARANIRVHVLGPQTGNVGQFINSGVIVSEVSGDIGDWRADGMASMAGAPAAGEAWIAWVRYKEDFLADKGTREIVTVCRECPQRERFSTEVVRDLQPQIDTTAIFVRQLTYSTTSGVEPAGGMPPLDISAPGINIEPELAVTTDGEAAVCVWVHDGLHTNLVDDNRGRSLHVSSWRRSSGAWSAPIPVIRDDILAAYPGVLEPRIAMSADGSGFLEGLIAFTALPEGSEPDDTGMGGLRYLYTVRFQEVDPVGLVFDDPVRIRGRCDETIYVWDYEVFWDIPDLVDPLEQIHKHGPDAVILFNRRGVPGTQHSAGEVMAAALGQSQVEWNAPVCLTDGSRTLTNVVSSVTPQGQVHSLFLDQGAAPQAVRAIQGAGAGAGPGGYQFIDAQLEPDLAIASCHLSQPFAGPGARVKATVRVENRGLTGSAMTAAGESVAHLEIRYFAGGGRERVANAASLPVLQPGEDHTVELTVEALHEPVRLIVRIVSNHADLDPSNDVLECDFGAPYPQDLTCRSVFLPGGEPRVAAVLEWENPVAYEELYVYRDGLLLTTIPGSSERYVDLRVGPGTYVYELRGAVGASRSTRVPCELTVLPPPEGTFRRGDTNDDGHLDISDAVVVLLFLFGSAPASCLDAADSNDDGNVDLSDSLYTLNFLYLAGPGLPSPGPNACGEDPTPDTLPACESSCG